MNAVQGADMTILSAGLVHNDLISEGYHSIRKAGALVVTGVGPDQEDGLQGINALTLAMLQKRIQGALYGHEISTRSHADAAEPVPNRQAEARRIGHPHLQSRPDQHRLRRHAQRPQHPRFHSVRLNSPQNRIRRPAGATPPAGRLAVIARPSAGENRTVSLISALTIITVDQLAAAAIAPSFSTIDTDGLPSTPLLVVDLDSTRWTAPLVDAAEGVLTHPASPITIGVATHRPPPEAAPLLAALTCTLAPEEWSRHVVAADVESLSMIADAIEQAPLASLALGGLLRLTSAVGVPEGLVAESLAYSTLLAGEEFAAWRASRPVRPIPELAAAPVLATRTGDRLDLTLNRPERRNAFGRAVRDGLLDAFDIAALDSSITEVHLHGAGPDFSSGGDLDEFGTATHAPTSHAIRLHRSAGYGLHRLADRPGTAVYAHLHGACIGAGIEIPAFATHVYASPDTRIRLPELSMGLVPGAGGTVGVVHRIGRWRTAWMVLTGSYIDAPTALRWGLIDALREPQPEVSVCDGR
ncbi:enoyl-CoA hydratase-related protein [Nocardia gipuzkoensis]|jgi:enoyl-CoA hydratase/carnithine racemase